MTILRTSDFLVMFDEVANQRDDAIKRAESAEARVRELEGALETSAKMLKSTEDERDELKRQLEQAIRIMDDQVMHHGGGTKVMRQFLIDVAQS